MNPVLYQANGVLPAGKYLPGVYAWEASVQLLSALLTCVPPSGGTFTLTLEIGGVSTAYQFTMAGSTPPPLLPGQLALAKTRVSLSLNVAVAANLPVRWIASFSGAPEQAPSEISVVMVPAVLAIADLTTARANLTVQYVGKPGQALTVFTYDSTTHLFIALPGLSSYASMAQDVNTLSISIQGVEALRVAGGILYVHEFVVLGGVATGTLPKLQFCRAVAGAIPVPLATLTPVDFRVTDLTEDTPTVLTSSDAGFFDRFELWGGGLVGTLNQSGLIANAMQEY